MIPSVTVPVTTPVTVPVPALGARTVTFPVWCAPALVAAILQLALMGAYVARFHGDMSVFVCAGSDMAQSWPLERVSVTLSKTGFDGQYYYIIARAPFAKQDSQFVALAPYRHMRILYPTLAWILSGSGDPVALFWVMPAINIVAIGGIAGLGAWFAARSGSNRWWGLLVPLLLNASTPALRNLTDPLATFTVFGFLVAWLLRWNLWALVLFAAISVFSREANVGVVGLVFLAAALKRNWAQVGGLFVVLLVWLGWFVHLWNMYDESPFLAGNFGVPFAGIATRLQNLRGDGGAGAPIHALGLAYIGALVVTALVMPLYRANWILALTALAGAGMAVCGSAWIYMDGHSYTRVFAFLPLGILVWAMHTGRRWPLLILSPALLWPVYALLQVWLR